MSNANVKPSPAAHPWSSVALLAKAQRYSRIMGSHDQDDWQFAFWSALTLEMLGRAAVANTSPALLADPKDWSHLHFALGHTPKANKFVPKSIETSAVFSRARDLVPNFDARLENFAALHLNRRNEELHSGGTPFDDAKPTDWLPLFYETCAVLLASLKETLDSLFGEETAIAAEELISAAKDEGAKAVQKDVQAHKTVWEARSLPDRTQASGQAGVWASRQGGHRVTCPACASRALVAGKPTSAPTVRLVDGIITETQPFAPQRFECIACGLKISGLSQLMACGLGDPYKATFSYEPAEYYGPQDDADGYEPDNNDI